MDIKSFRHGCQTNSLTKGGCQLCGSYSSWTRSCLRGRSVDYRSYIQYEWEKAAKDGLRIVVIYNSAYVYKDKCPESVRNKGTHINGYYKDSNEKYYWNYEKIKNAIMGNNDGE